MPVYNWDLVYNFKKDNSTVTEDTISANSFVNILSYRLNSGPSFKCLPLPQTFKLHIPTKCFGGQGAVHMHQKQYRNFLGPTDASIF